MAIASAILLLISISTAAVLLSAAEVNIISKAAWNGRESKAELSKLTAPIPKVVIAHTAGTECNSPESCSEQVRNLQAYHMEKAHFDDIAYNFLVGNDGRIYEGRGWDQVGAFARGHNAESLGIAFIGTFESALPSQTALDAAKSLLETGVSLGKIASDYKLFGHRQLSQTQSPGSALYEEIKQWPNWSRQDE